MLTGDLPCTVEHHGERESRAITFTLDLRGLDRHDYAPKNLSLDVVIDGLRYGVRDDWFEEGVQRPEAEIPEGTNLVCCVTCLYSGQQHDADLVGHTYGPGLRPV